MRCFLRQALGPHGDGRLNPKVLNTAWNLGRDYTNADKEKIPHSARHGMGVFIMETTGNVAAGQRQLGQKNASFSLQYSRITYDELKRSLKLKNRSRTLQLTSQMPDSAKSDHSKDEVTFHDE